MLVDLNLSSLIAYILIRILLSCPFLFKFGLSWQQGKNFVKDGMVIDLIVSIACTIRQLKGNELLHCVPVSRENSCANLALGNRSSFLLPFSFPSRAWSNAFLCVICLFFRVMIPPSYEMESVYRVNERSEVAKHGTQIDRRNVNRVMSGTLRFTRA